MRKLIFLIGLAFCISLQCLSQNSSSEEFDWTEVINAIAQVESKGNPNAVSSDGSCVGLLQMKKIAVDDVNQYLRMLGSKKRYKYEDRKDPQKSKEMFILMQKRYNKENNIEKAIRLWNGGCRYSIAKTNKYYKKVMSYKSLQGNSIL